MGKQTRSDMRVVRHRRVRKKARGAAERPRLAVFRSLRHISAQIIDDDSGKTLCSASTMEKDVTGTGNLTGAVEVGKTLGARAKGLGIQAVVFDRGGFKYHGAVKALADAVREAGVEF